MAVLLCRQGDESMYTDEALKAREEVQYHPKVSIDSWHLPIC
jgi:hypothetical protein